jgi:hypothetical protein
MKHGQHVPLRWPSNWPRAATQRVSNFDGGRTLLQAVKALVEELETKGFADGVVVAAGFGNATAPRSNEDHGAAVYFTRTKTFAGAKPAGDLRSPSGKIPYVLACDTFTHVADNVWAIKKHVEAIRMMERIGVGTTEQILQGFAQLPPSKDAKGEPAAEPARPWRDVLNFNLPIYEQSTTGSTISRDPTVEEVKDRHRARLIELRTLRPDGSHPGEPALNAARDEAIEELTSAREPGKTRGSYRRRA